jgi:hypothetical protein
VQGLWSCAELAPEWLYARALFHGKAPHGLYAAALKNVSTRDLLRQFARLPSPDCDEFASSAAAELYGREDLDPGAVARLSDEARLRLADALGRRGREECVPLYRQLLEPYRKAKSGGWVNALGGLGFYHSNTGHYRDAIDTFLSIGEYTTAPHVIMERPPSGSRTHRPRRSRSRSRDCRRPQ